MNYSVELIERARAQFGSYYEVAKQAGCSRQHISLAKDSKTGIGPFYARVLAEKLGEDPDAAEHLALAERARSHRERDYWKALAGIAAGVILSLSVIPLMSLSSNAYGISEFNPSIHYAQLSTVFILVLFTWLEFKQERIKLHDTERF